MNDVLSLAAFAGKIVCLMVFVTVLRPDKIGAVEAPARPATCTTGDSVQRCGPGVLDKIKALNKWW
ncbi:MAG TPA: hypothetical protein VN838_19550 [Bradyrhizobium sp.]|nr:hypothetical protein [Bradyrhizobium sp.]